MSDETRSRAEQISDALTGILDDEMVTGYLLVAQTIDDDGVQGCWVLTQPGQMPWTSLGMVEFARTRVDSAVEEIGGGEG